MAVVLVSTDLMAASRIEGAAARLGVPFQTAANFDVAAAKVAEGPVELLIVDLTSVQAAVASGVKLVKDGAVPPARILAFGPHVHDRLLTAAKHAGCDDVLTRGQFFATVDAILSSCAPPRA